MIILLLIILSVRISHSPFVVASTNYHPGVPVYYECQRCTACCRWPGEVRLAEGEIARLAAFKGMREVPFIQQFTRLTADRRGLSLQEKPNGECIFLEGND